MRRDDYAQKWALFMESRKNFLKLGRLLCYESLSIIKADKASTSLLILIFLFSIIVSKVIVEKFCNETTQLLFGACLFSESSHLTWWDGEDFENESLNLF